MPQRASRGQAMIIKMPCNLKSCSLGNVWAPTEPPANTGLIVFELILGLLVGPISCRMGAPATDKPLLRP